MAKVQFNDSINGAGTTGTNFLAGTTAGNDLVVAIVTLNNSGAQSVVSVTDSAGNTYSHVANTLQSLDSTTATIDLWHAHSIAGGDITTTVTVGASAANIYVATYEVSSLTGAVDDSDSTQDNSAVSHTDTVAGSASDFFVTMLYSGTVIPAPDGWTLDNGNYTGIMLASQSGGGNVATTWDKGNHRTVINFAAFTDPVVATIGNIGWIPANAVMQSRRTNRLS